MKFLAPLFLALSLLVAPPALAQERTAERCCTYSATLMDRGNKDPVYDADTVWLTVDLGFGVKLDLGSVRLYGINAPEVRGAEREKGLMARDYVREVLSRPENRHFKIRTEQDKKGKYGRYLVTIILPDGTDLNEKLVILGLAEVNFYD